MHMAGSWTNLSKQFCVFCSQVYVRSELSADVQQAAQQALLTHCAPLLAHSHTEDSDMDSDDNRGSQEPEPFTASQLSLFKPCAWPHLVTASHFASSSQLATLARDAALWECFYAELVAKQLSAQCDTEQSRGTYQPAVASGNAVLHSMFPTGAQAAVVPARQLQRQSPAADLQEQSQLCMLWQAAACFAERADSSDAQTRAMWTAFTAQSMQVSCCSGCLAGHTIHLYGAYLHKPSRQA